MPNIDTAPSVSTEKNTAPKDALADVLKTIRLTAQAYFCSHFQAPWGVQMASTPQGHFHAVIHGHCWLTVDNQDTPIELQSGDIVAFPTGGGHHLSDQIDSPLLSPQDFMQRGARDTNSSAAPRNTILCGHFLYDTSIKHPFLRDLPCFIHIKASQTPELDWLRQLVEVIAEEFRQPSPGSSVMTDRLTEVLFIQLLRAHMQAKPNKLGYMAALTDPQIGLALNYIHGETEAYWNVERLAQACGQSRTRFTENFTGLVGLSPKNYLTQWRMQKAHDQLINTNLSMIDIAEKAGYASEAAFSKAFKQQFSTPPGRARRAEHQN